MDYEEYFSTCWENIDYAEIAFEFYLEHQDVFNELTFNLFNIFKVSGAIPPMSASRVIVLTFNFKL